MEGKNNKILVAVKDPAIKTAINSSITDSKLEIIALTEFSDILSAFSTEKFSAVVIEDCILKRNELITAIKAHLATNEQMPSFFGISPTNEHIEHDFLDKSLFIQVLTMCIGINLRPQIESACELYNLRIEKDVIEKQRNEAQQKIIYIQTNNEDIIANGIDSAEKEKHMALQQCIQKSTYLAKKSHALRNILHGILSFANIGIMKSDTASPDKMKGFFQYIADSGHKLEHILEELVYLSKLESNRINIDIVEHNIYKAIKQSVDHQSSILGEKNIAVDIEMLMDNQRLEFDKEMVVTLFDNLISNAATYSDNDKNVQVLFEDCKINSDTPAKKIIIKDQGHGFSQPLDKVFEKYYIPENKDKMAPDAGLGLAICDEIVAKHSGSIEIVETGDNGSTIEVILPLKQPEASCEQSSMVQAFSFDEEFTDYSADIESVLNAELQQPKQTIPDTKDKTSDSLTSPSDEKKKETEPAEDLGANVDLF